MAEVKKRILIVDDEKDVGWTLKLILENYGFDIDCFTCAHALEQTLGEVSRVGAAPGQIVGRKEHPLCGGNPDRCLESRGSS